MKKRDSTAVAKTADAKDSSPAKPKPEPKDPNQPVTAPVIRYNPISIPAKVYLRSMDVLLSVALLFAVTVILLLGGSEARVTDLIHMSKRSMKRQEAAAGQVLPNVVSADLLLLVLGGMAVNAFVVAVIGVVEREHRREVEQAAQEEIMRASDLDPAVSDAYEKQMEEQKKARLEKRASLTKDNETRKKENRPLLRPRVVLNQIVEVDSVTDAVVPVIVCWPIVAGTAVVLLGANAIRGLGMAIMLAQMAVSAVLPKLLGSTNTARAVFGVMQTAYHIAIAVLIALQTLQ